MRTLLCDCRRTNAVSIRMFPSPRLSLNYVDTPFGKSARTHTEQIHSHHVRVRKVGTMMYDALSSNYAKQYSDCNKRRARRLDKATLEKQGSDQPHNP